MDGLVRKSERLAGKRIALCVTGSAAAIEAPKLARELIRHGAEVVAYMSRKAAEILGRDAMWFATRRQPVTRITGELEYLREFDCVVVAPASANTIAKLAMGIADTPPTLVCIASRCSVMVAPAMHLSIYDNEAVRRNLLELERRGVRVIPPVLGEGAAKLAPVQEIAEYVIRETSRRELAGKRVVITAGATEERIDSIRIITNRSSGRMGIALAKEAFYRGADVTLIAGRLAVEPPRYVEHVPALSVEEMLEEVKRHTRGADVFICAAAIGDFLVEAPAEGKLSSSEEHTLKLKPAPKVLEAVKDRKMLKVAFKAVYAAGMEDMINEAKSLLERQNLDLVIANDVSKGIFGSEDTETVMVDDEDFRAFPRMPKEEISYHIFEEVCRRLRR